MPKNLAKRYPYLLVAEKGKSGKNDYSYVSKYVAELENQIIDNSKHIGFTKKIVLKNIQRKKKWTILSNDATALEYVLLSE